MPKREPAPVAPQPEEVVTVEEMAAAMASLLTPAFALILAMTLWRLGQDLGFANNFFVSEGVWSHWQVWLALAVAVQALSIRLNRKARARARQDQPATN